MFLLEVLHLDDLSHGLANLPMFPYFDMAHFIMSVVALREQPGRSPKPRHVISHRGRLSQAFPRTNNVTLLLFSAVLSWDICHAPVTL